MRVRKKLFGSRDINIRMLFVFIIMILVCLSLSLQAKSVSAASFSDEAFVWKISSNGKAICYVGTKKIGESVALGLKCRYFKDVFSQQKAYTKELITVEKVPYGEVGSDKVLGLNDAIYKIERFNNQALNKGNPVVTVSMDKLVSHNKPVNKKVKVIKTMKLEKGDKKVKVNGNNGENKVVSGIKIENGKIKKKQVVNETVTKKTVTKVVYEGTRISDLDKGRKIVEFGLQYLGTKYVLGGEDLENGIDCSGFTKMCYKQFGIDLPHSSAAQRNVGNEVKDLKDAQAGDLILYEGHVTMYIDDGMFVHASPGQVSIGENPNYSKIITIRRVIGTDLEKTIQHKAFEDKYDKIYHNIDPRPLLKEFYKKIADSLKKDKEKEDKKKALKEKNLENDYILEKENH